MKTKELDMYGRVICDEKDCPAFFEYVGSNTHVVKCCDANQMYFSQQNVLCKIIKEYKIVKA